MAASSYWIDRCNELDAKNRALRAQIERLQVLIDTRPDPQVVGGRIREAIKDEARVEGETVFMEGRGHLVVGPDLLDVSIKSVLSDHLGNTDSEMRDRIVRAILRRITFQNMMARQAA